jgi:2-C-methyl-D-erythritol 4-phosphate cytidylyltransferase
MKYSFLLLSGGVGDRSALGYPKQLHTINGHPMLAYALIAAGRVAAIDEIVLNFPGPFEEQTRTIVDAYVGKKTVKFAPAGKTRQESTELLAKAAKNDHVILHEAARPMITAFDIETLIASQFENVSYCVPISYSVCSVDPATQRMLKRVDRATTLNIQLPQKFRRATLLAAHAKAREKGVTFTEDAMMLRELLDADVRYIKGKDTNIKVTTPEDFIFADAVFKRSDRDD